ncbi:MAG: phosphoserine phosphatase [Subdoligranulum sp.]|nr:phosphoserine phosphatase [Subdoligranulum sp.]
MNVYDFDKTIYAGDSTLDFYWYCLGRHPALIKHVHKQLWAGLLYAAGKIGITEFKECFFSFLPEVPVLEEQVEKFWDLRQKRIKAWYLEQKQSDDVIISASPSFLLIPICKRLKIALPIATEADPLSGKITGENCKGEEKVRRFFERYPRAEVQAFYSDSATDSPLAALAREAFLVRGDMRMPWPQPHEGQ